MQTVSSPEGKSVNSNRRSPEPFATFVVGSLPRPEDLLEMLGKQDRGDPVDTVALHARTAEAVKQVVKDQVEAGIDVVSDGEMSKMAYNIYAKHRLTGLGATDGTGVPGRKTPRDIQDFPEMEAAPLGGGGPELLQATVCNGPVA